MSNKVNEAGVVGAFIVAHPEIPPDQLGYVIQSALRYLKKQKQDVTLPHMEWAVDRLKTAVDAMHPDAEEPKHDAELDALVKQIDSWSSAEMREFCKDSAVAAAVEAVLSQPRPKKEEPKSQPKAEFKPPVRSAEEKAIEGMTSEQMKKAMLDPVKARGIENVLAAAAAPRKS